MTTPVTIRVDFPVDDVSLSRLHAIAFGNAPGELLPWANRLQQHSVSWVGAFHQDSGYNLVQTLIQRVRAAGCEWLHVDYEPHLDSFYRDACGFKTTQAGLLRLSR